MRLLIMYDCEYAQAHEHEVPDDDHLRAYPAPLRVSDRRAHIPVATLDSRSCGPTEGAGIAVVGTRQRQWSGSESEPRCTTTCVIMAPRRASPLAEGRGYFLLSRVQMMCCLVAVATIPIRSSLAHEKCKVPAPVLRVPGSCTRGTRGRALGNTIPC